MTGETRRDAINWRQAGGEGLLIFMGFVVALLGQAWWEDRSERSLVQEHAASLPRHPHLSEPLASMASTGMSVATRRFLGWGTR